MADHQYTCPKCSAVLRPKNAVAAGAKIKCPKCQNVFEPVAAPAPPAEETYGIVMETEAEKQKETEIKQKSLAKLEDRRPKSARGPAVAECTGPGNKMLFVASLTCVSCIFSIVVIMWPMFFSKNPVVDKQERAILMAAAVLAFVYNYTIAHGSVKMLSIESDSWAWMAAIMMVFPLQYGLSFVSFNWLVRLVNLAADPLGGLFVPLALSALYIFVGVKVITTLRKPAVRAGFAEAKPSDN